MLGCRYGRLDTFPKATIYDDVKLGEFEDDVNPIGVEVNVKVVVSHINACEYLQLKRSLLNVKYSSMDLHAGR